MHLRPCITGSSAILLAFVLLVSGCAPKGSDPAGTVTLTFWHSCVSSTVPALNELVAKFEQEHPSIKIKMQYVPSGDAHIQKLVTAVQSRTAPDISWIHADYLQDLVEADAIYLMDDFVHGEDSLAQSDLDDIYPALTQTSKWRGKLYSIPMEATGIGLLLNKELFRNAGLDPERPPRDWAELRDYARRLTLDRNGDGKNEQVGFFVPVFPASGPLNGWMVWQWYPFLYQAGGEVIDLAQTRVLFNDEGGVRALSLWKDIYNDLHLNRFTIDYEVAFASKQLAMTLDGPWNLPRWAAMKNLDWAVAPLPAGPSKRCTIVGGEYLAIFKQTTHPKEAWTFVKWILRPDVQAFWSMKSGYLPVRRAASQVKEYEAYLAGNPGMKAYVEQMEVGIAPRPIDFESLKIMRTLADAIERSTLGNADPKAALDEAAAKSNELLRAARKK